MAPHSSILAWKIPWTEEPGRLQSVAKEISWKLKRQKETLERISQGIQLLELPEREFILFC